MKLLKKILKFFIFAIAAIIAIFVSLLVFTFVYFSAPNLELREAEIKFLSQHANEILEMQEPFPRIDLPLELTKMGIEDINISDFGIFYCKRRRFVESWGYFVPRDPSDFRQKSRNGKIQDGDVSFSLISQNIYAYHIAG